MNDKEQTFSGYDLAHRIFIEAQDDPVSAYIDLAGDETSWLEFKAGMYSRPEDRKPNESVDESFWHVSKAVLGMLNSSGGVVVIGVQDGTFEAVALSENNPDNIFEKGLEAYVRLAIAKNIPPERIKWNTSKGPYQFSCQIPPGHVQIERVIYHGKDIALVFVKPLGDCLTIKHGNAVEMPVRFQDDRGKVDTLKSYEEMRDWERTRKITDEKYNALYDKFKQQRASRDFSAILGAKIDDYYRGLAQRAHDEMAVFTPLDAAENAFGPENVDSFYSPEAVEWKESASSWLDDDDEEDEEQNKDASNLVNRNDEDEGGKDEDEQDSELEDEGEDGEESDTQPERRGDLLGILGEVPRAIVAGEPGGGKTTCLTYFALQFQKEMGEQKTLAVFIPMGQWEHGGSLERMILKASGLDLSQLESLIASNRLRLVIDAVNECPDKYRSAAILDIHHFLLANPDTSVVISTRHPEELASLDLPVFQVQPMDDGHRQKFLERYLGSSEAAEALLSQLRKMPGGDTISENPMLLRLVVEVYRESPGQKLPAGRAGLYRRSLRSWYKREKDKREESGEALSFSRKEALSLLAELAFKSRVGGFRAVPLEEVRNVWGDTFEEKIAEICQGPIVYVENEFLKFRHETFQEYLTAEYLVKTPDALPKLTHKDYAQWGMPLAYLVELCELNGIALPKSAWLAAWSLNPWLGVALTDKETGNQLLTIVFSGERPSAFGKQVGSIEDGEIVGKVYLDAIAGYWTNYSLQKALHKSNNPWYSRKDSALQYIIAISEEARNRWLRFEKSQVSSLNGLWDKYAIKLANSWLLLKNARDIFQYHIPEEWDSWIQKATPSSAIGMLKAGIAIPADFYDIKQRWIDNLKLLDGIELHNLGVFNQNELKDKVEEWIENRASTIAVLKSGLIAYSHEILATKKEKAQKSNSPKKACFLVACGLATKDDFYDEIPNWIESAKIQSMPTKACQLIEAGFATKEDFLEAVPLWIEKAKDSDSPTMACKLISFGYALRDAFTDSVPKWIATWIKTPNAKSLDLLLKHGFINDNDLSSSKLLESISPEFACSLIKKGILRSSAFSSLLQNWFSGYQYAYVRDYINNSGDQQAVEFLHSNIPLFKEHASIRSALLLIKDDLASKADFPLLDASMSYMSTSEQKTILESGLLSQDELTAAKLRTQSIMGSFQVGSIVYGRVESVLTNGAIININMKGIYGFLRRRDYCWRHEAERGDEFVDVGQTCKFKVIAGGRGDVFLGIRQLSPNPWHLVESKFVKDADMSGTIKKQVKGGWLLDLDGWDAFLPNSEIDIDKSVAPIIGQVIQIKIINAKPDLGSIVVSRKKLIEENKKEEKNKRLRLLCIGQTLSGAVKNITDFGAFIDLGDVDGLLHINDMSWGRVKHPSDLLEIGQEIEVIILGIDIDRGRVSLGLKQLQPNPWEGVENRYPIGSRQHGKVVNLVPYGAFVELEQGIEGLVHVSQISTNPVAKVQDVLTVGQEVEARIIRVDPAERRIALSMKAVGLNDEEFKALVQEENAKAPNAAVEATETAESTS